jgi:acetyltransferase-like isoleucine patch superfamily enzyme
MSGGLRDTIRHVPLLGRLLVRLYFLPRDVGYLWGPRVMSRLRKWWVIARNPHATIKFTEPLYLGPGFSLHMPYGGRLTVGPYVEFRRGFRAEILPAGHLEIGAGTVFTNNVLIQCGRTIKIGERCMFGQSAMVVDGNHRYRDLTKPMLEQGYDFSPVVIEDDVTTTTKCTIIGARIGTRTFVGANSVVNKDIPAYTLAVGSPAKPVDYYGPPGEEPAELKAASVG